MQDKLTLRLDDKLIRKAKSHARRSGRSVSQLVADYFKILGANRRPKKREPLHPVVLELKGVLKGSGLDEGDYRRHLEEKYL